MDQLRSNSGNAEDNSGIPDDLRCKRSDGKQWRCTAMSMPDKTVCEKHYIQAKKRAANSQMRAKKRKSLGEADIYLESKSDDFDVPAVSVSSKKYKEKVPKNQIQYSPEEPLGTNNINMEDDSQVDGTSFEENLKSQGTPSLTATDGNRSQTSFDDIATAAEDSDDSSDEGFVGQTCHQCRQNDKERVTWCLKCEKRGYCDSCIFTWYSDLSMEEFEKACPACRGSCYCKVCIRGDNMIKVRIREMPVLDKLHYLYSLLSSVLPVAKKIHHEQSAEVELEKKLRGKEIDLARVRLNADEQMCCNICRIPIIDYHRHCSNCSYDLCISCCQDLRGTSLVGVHSDIDSQTGDRSQVKETAGVELSQSRMSLSDKFPGWIANSDGSIPCPPKEHGGCGHQSLNLNRIFKMNWVAKLVKNVEEMVSGCKVYDIGSPLKIDMNEPSLCRFADREGGNDNFLYCPSSQVIKDEGIADFRKHWAKGEPIIVNQVCDNSSVSSWDPMVIWTGIWDTADEKVKEEGRTIKAIDCLDWSEVEIEVEQFIKGYSEGRIRGNGLPEILKLKDWPYPSASEEFLMYQRPEFISKLPLLEFIHSRLGLLNVAAKLPHYSLQNDVGPKIYISYGTNEEFGGGDPVTNLHFKMRDMVYLLVHTCKMKVKGQEHTNMMEVQLKKGEEHSNMTEIQPSNGESEVIELLEDHEKHTNMMEMQPSNGESEVIGPLEDHEKRSDERKSPDLSVAEPDLGNESGMNSSRDEDVKMEEVQGTKNLSVEEETLSFEKSNGDCGECLETTRPGAAWDVFRREDVPKLVEFLQVHWGDVAKLERAKPNSVSQTLHDEVVFLNELQKRKLKEEYGVEPWSFEQHVGEAVFIPAGCPFQLKNLQSTVQLGLDFLFPESVREAARLAEEIRILPNDHEAKLQILEVGKISLYAASSAIREVQKLVLDPKLGKELGFEDPNLTASVSENLEKVKHNRQITCR